MRDPEFHPDEPDVERLFDEVEQAVGDEVALSETRARREKDAAEEIQALRESKQKLHMLLDVTESMNAKGRTDEVLDQILDASLTISGGERAYILRLDARGQLETVASRYREGVVAGPQESPDLSHSSIEQVFREGQTLVVDDTRNDPDFMMRRSVKDLSLRSILCVPLGSRGQVTGALYVDSRSVSRMRDPEAKTLLETFAGQAGVALTRAREHERLEKTAEDLVQQNQSLREALGDQTRFDRILGQSAAMKKVFSLINRVIQNPVTVHIQGETGTGKDLVAQALHFNGPRKDGDFVAVNCGAISESLLESELFGHARGAFTGADRDHVGMIERADGGTLFLDEIGEIPHALQVNLLRVLQEGVIRRVGDSRDRTVDVRIITATHRDLETEVRDGRMRQDFYFRINVVTISLPPLRDRDDDVLLLAERFLDDQRRKLDRPALAFSTEAKRRMLAHPWPGNVRELMNRVERASALAETDVISSEDLTLDTPGGSVPAIPTGGSLKDILQDVEIQVIRQALRDADFVMARAAKNLGMSRQNLYARIRRFDIDTSKP